MVITVVVNLGLKNVIAAFNNRRQDVPPERLYNIRTYALVTKKQDFEIASLRRNDRNS
jgi:hypothetical protein